MIRDCSYFARRAEILERLAVIAAQIERWNLIFDRHIREVQTEGKAYTDPRNGVTYFPK